MGWGRHIACGRRGIGRPAGMIRGAAAAGDEPAPVGAERPPPARPAPEIKLFFVMVRPPAAHFVQGAPAQARGEALS